MQEHAIAMYSDERGSFDLEELGHDAIVFVFGRQGLLHVKLYSNCLF